MEDLKQIQEFFSKPLEENVDKKYSDFLVALRDSGVTNMFGAGPYLQAEFGLDKREAREILANWMRSFGESLNENVHVEAFKLGKALKGMGYDVKVKAVDDFGKNVFEIYFNNPADADDDSIFYDAKKLGYDNVRVFANPQESLDEAYIVTYAKNKGEKPASAAYKLRGSALAFMRDLEKDGYITMLTQKPVDGVDEALDEYNTGIYFRPDKASKRNKKVSKSTLDKIADIVKKATIGDYEPSVTEESKPKKGHGEKISKEVFAKLKGKTVNYKGTDYKVIDSEEAIITLKDEDGKTKTLNLKQFNDSGLIDEIIETVLLGRQLNEELCPKGKAYIKKRQAAGEKSSAYLSGRAVKVCKGQMKG